MQGIEKCIAEYKKQQGKKSRERDKAKKSLLKEKNNQEKLATNNLDEKPQTIKSLNLPWSLLVFSWVGFILYINLS